MNDMVLNKSWSSITYNFEYFTCRFFHPFHVDVFGVSRSLVGFSLFSLPVRTKYLKLGLLK